MDPNALIPTPDTIPAPPWIFIVLEQLLFLLHILVVNAVLGGALILLIKKFQKSDPQYEILYKPTIKKFPILTALAINFAIPPLLFLQVVFGHLFYTSSILMATYWIAIIPLLVIAYYGFYVHCSARLVATGLAKAALLCSILIMLYIGFMLVLNNVLMEQPERWTAYFQNSGGLFLNLSDATILPRFLHFLTASVAVGALFIAIMSAWKQGGDQGRGYLRLFGFATMAQFLIGSWYLMSLPSVFIKNFMGGDMVSSIFLLIGFVVGLLSIVFAMKGKLVLTIVTLLVTVIAMLITRHNVRMMYLADNFTTDQLTVVPQYGNLVLFLITLLLGLAAIAYMVRLGFSKTEEEVVA